jgi:alkanesulfonate monooxygenase SsuD/methylene tetrahydromethanopterin reductase-like flavin-dependent oxidoreductase (luciferase family)
VDGALLGERLGFSTGWKGEGNHRAPGIVLSAIAARTSHIAVGRGVNHGFARTPVSFAVEAATLNELVDGRYIAGLGVGKETVARWHVSVYRTPTKIIREYVSVVRRVYAREWWDG